MSDNLNEQSVLVDNPESQGYLPVNDLADKYGYAKDHIGWLARTGRIQAVRYGKHGRWYVDEKSLLNYRKSLTDKTPKVPLPTLSPSFNEEQQNRASASGGPVLLPNKGSYSAKQTRRTPVVEISNAFGKEESKSHYRAGNAIPKKLLLIAGGVLFLMNFVAAVEAIDLNLSKTPIAKQYSQIKETVSADILEPVRGFVRRYLLPDYGYETYLVIDPSQQSESRISRVQEARIEELERQISNFQFQISNQTPTTNDQISKDAVVIRELVPQGTDISSLLAIEQRVNTVLSDITSINSRLSSIDDRFQFTPTVLQLPPTNTKGIGPITSNVDTVNTDTLTVTGGSTLASLGITNDLTVDTNVLKVDTSNNRVGINTSTPEVAFEVVGVASISGNVNIGGTLTALGNIGIGTTLAPNQLTVIGSGSFTGQLKATRNPTLAHTGTWPSFTNTNDSTVLINPSSPVADGNVIAYVSGSDPKFVVDTEGDIYGNNLILTGSTTTGTTTIAGDLNVEGNARFGDASGDKLRFVGTVLPDTLTSNIFTIQASPSWTGDYYLQLLDSSSNKIFSVASTSLFTLNTVNYTFPSSQGGANTFLKNDGNGLLTWSTAGVSSNSLDFDEFVDNMTLDGNLTIASNSFNINFDDTQISFPGGIITTGGNMGIGTTAPSNLLHVNRGSALTSALLRLEDTSTGDATIQYRVSGATSWFTGIDNSDSDKFKIGTAEGFGSSVLMTIQTDGNVAVGTTSAVVPLTVEGRITSQNSTNGWLTLWGTSGESYFTRKQGTLLRLGVENNQLGSGFVDQLTITGGGNVGIGTTGPTSLLSVFNSTATASFDITSQGQTDKMFTIKSNYQGSGDAERLTVYNGAGTELFRIASTGALGIGNFEEQGRSIGGGAASSTSLDIWKNTDNFFGIRFTGATGRDFMIGRTTCGSKRCLQIGDDVGSKFMSFAHNNDGTANVGIGTTGPTTKFHVVGDNNSLFQASGVNSEVFVTLRGNQREAILHGDRDDQGTVNQGVGLLTLDGRTDKGADGTFGTAARIKLSGGATVSNPTTDIPGQIEFWTVPDSSATLAERMRITEGGDICDNGNDADLSDCASDVRLKENIVSYEYGLNEILRLRPVRFNWNELAVKEFGNDPNLQITGFIAQEVEEVIPEWVVDNGQGYKKIDGVGYLSHVLVNAVKELNAKTSSLSFAIDNLQSMLASQGESLDSSAIFDLSILFNSIVKKFYEAMNIVFENGLVKVARGIFEEVTAKNLCVADGSGEKTCVTKAQLDALLSGQNVNLATPTPESEEEEVLVQEEVLVEGPVEETASESEEAIEESTNPTPTPEPTPSPSSSPTPESTPEPSPEPEPELTPEPTPELIVDEPVE